MNAPTPTPKPPASRFRKVARVAGRVALGLLIVVLLLPPALLVALRFDAPRAFAAHQVDQLLAGLFRGRIHVAAIEQVGLGGARVTGSIDDPKGHRVISFQSVTVRLNVPALLLRLVRDGGAPSVIRIDEVAIPHAEIALIDDGTGAPTLAHTFDPQSPSPPPTTPSAPPPTLSIARIRIDHAWVHGALGSSPHIDAELSEARAKLGLDRKAFQVDLSDARSLVRFPTYDLNPRGRLVGRLEVPLGAGPLVADTTFTGVAAGTSLVAQASLDGQRLRAEAQIPELGAATVRAFVPDLTLRGTLRVAARAEGTLDALDLMLDIAGDAGELSARGKLDTGTPLRANAALTGRRWDVSAVVPSAPQTSIALEGTLSVEVDQTTTRAHYELGFRRPNVAGKQLPDIRTRGALEARETKLAVDGNVSASEAGTQAEATYAVRLAGERGSVETALELKLADSPRLVALAGVRTRGTVNARARLSFPDPALRAVADAKLEGVERGPDRLGATRAHVEVEGKLADPTARATVSIALAHVLGRDFSALRTTFEGTPSKAHVELALTRRANERLRVASELGFSDGTLALTNTTAHLRDRQGALDLVMARAKLGDGKVRLDGLVLRGAGDATASLALEGSRLHVAARTDRLDVVRLLRLAGISTPLLGTRATLELELERGRSLDVQLRGNLAGVSFGTVDDGKASFDLRAKNDAWSGEIASELVPGAPLVIAVRQLRATRLLEPKAELPEGELRAQGRVDLGCMTPLFAAIPAVPIESAKGKIDIDLDYGRDSVAAAPRLAGHVRTHDLEVVEKREPRPAIGSSAEAIQAAPASFRGIDFGIDLLLDAPTRRLTAHLGAYDARAALLSLDAEAGPLPDGSLSDVAARIDTVPLDVRVTVPVRRLAELPEPIRPLSLRGKVAGDLSFDGSIAEPHLVANVRASRLSAAGERIQGEVKPRFAVIGHVEYRKTGGQLALVADAAHTRALDAEVKWTGDLLRVARDPRDRDGVTVHGHATLDRLDLEGIPALKNRQIEGVVSGTAAVAYGASERSVSANLVAHPLRTGQATVDRINIALDAAPGHLRGAIDAGGRSGTLKASVTSGLAWPAQGTPSLQGDIVAALTTRQFRLATLAPLVSGKVNELDGRLDSNLSARVQGEKVTLSGGGSLRDGVLQIPTVGQRFEAISARVSVAPSAILIDDVSARGITGGLRANAKLALDEHLALRKLDARVEIEKNQKIPITLEGVALGDAWGKIEAHVVNDPNRIAVRVRVPEIHIDVPETDRAGVQSLAPDERIRIGARRADAVFTALPLEPIETPSENPTPVDVEVELGSVWVRRGDLVNAELTGKIHVAVAEKSQVTGRIDLKGGTLDVSGKRFEIESGSVTFTGGDPSNPTISALARWNSPAGYVVSASYTGTATKGKLTLTAEPSLSQDEIVNLILFGTPEGANASGGDTASEAVGVAGGTAARGINRAISDLTHLDIQARVDTSTGAARPELMIPVSPRVSARVTRAIGDPPPGSSPDRTFLTLELRLKRDWALSALLGDRGASALDLIWRKHY
ncbi:MAG TPA: translocation/assembly module TamB domain-containing protein [Polyangiaceae bacterium]|nr:translocation/assembly module TamB domain-containing protein [Polyangiaceae bacterium]